MQAARLWPRYLEGKLERSIARKMKDATDEALREPEEDALRKEERAVMDLLREELESDCARSRVAA
ncbi:MAG: hypothetical protein ACRD3S_05245 [Terracidiphilus sp.]